MLRMIVTTGALLTIASPGLAQTTDAADPPARPTILQQLYDCRTIADPAERLACFDRQVSALATAETSRDIAIIDREQVRRTRQGLFGFSLGDLGSIFGGGDPDDNDNAEERADRVDRIESVLRAVGRDRSGKLVLILENGQQWVQTDTSGGRSPRAGQNVIISRASLGGFIASVDGRSGFRVRRER